MIKLLKKEFLLCLHPTSVLFVLFAAFVFIPNYPYEVAFFFTGLSVFFVCLTARENGDAALSCTLPVKKREIALARMAFCICFQLAQLALTGALIAIKECCFPASAQLNMAGSCANLALLGHGFLLLGAFNLVYFPWYFKNPVKVGVPFVVAAGMQFLIIALLCVLRFAAPVYSTLFTQPDPAYLGEKAVAFCLGLAFYLGGTALGLYLSARNFERTDL